MATPLRTAAYIYQWWNRLIFQKSLYLIFHFQQLIFRKRHLYVSAYKLDSVFLLQIPYAHRPQYIILLFFH